MRNEATERPLYPAARGEVHLGGGDGPSVPGEDHAGVAWAHSLWVHPGTQSVGIHTVCGTPERAYARECLHPRVPTPESAYTRESLRPRVPTPESAYTRECLRPRVPTPESAYARESLRPREPTPERAYARECLHPRVPTRACVCMSDTQALSGRARACQSLPAGASVYWS